MIVKDRRGDLGYSDTDRIGVVLLFVVLGCTFCCGGSFAFGRGVGNVG